MKPYPTQTLSICSDDPTSNEIVGTAIIPTPEALSKWKDYLAPVELDWYDSLPTIEQLQISLSCDPLNAIKQKLGIK